jgi:hypothetical protein
MPRRMSDAARAPFSLARYSEQQVLIALVFAFFAAKLAVALFLVPVLQHRFGTIYHVGGVDYYNWIAKNIAWGHGYRITPDTALTLMREPGYPYFLSEFVRHFENYHVPGAIANIVLSCLSGLCIGKLATIIWDAPWVSVIAATLFLVHPGVIIAESRLAIEILFIFLLLAFFFGLRRALLRQRTGDFAVAGLLLGIVCLVRSTPLLFPLAVGLYLVCRADTLRIALKSVGHVAVMLGMCLLVLSPWIARNYLLVHRFIPTASVEGIALQTGLYKCMHEDSDQTFVQLDDAAAAARNVLARQRGFHFVAGYYQLFFRPQDEVAFSDGLKRDALRTYEQSPLLLLECGSQNVFNFWFRGTDERATIGAMACQLPYLLLAAAGLLIGLRKSGLRRGEGTTLAALLLFVGYTMVVCLPIQGQARYSVPLVPILAIFAALPISRLLERRQRLALHPQDRLGMISAAPDGT